MKKNVKRILVLLLALSLVFVFCGCDALDEMRQQQAFTNSDGTITWQGNIYKPLMLRHDYFSPDSADATTVFVTEPDVPVLLSSVNAKLTMLATADSRFLFSLYGESKYYCIESAFDEISKRVALPFIPEIVCYPYGYYNAETGHYETRYYTLNQEQLDAINLVTETVEPTVLNDGMYLDIWYAVYLQECSEDMLFRRDAMELAISGNTYYITLYTEEGSVLFTVPSGLNATFDEIFQAAMEGEGFYKPDLPVTDEII